MFKLEPSPTGLVSSIARLIIQSSWGEGRWKLVKIGMGGGTVGKKKGQLSMASQKKEETPTNIRLGPYRLSLRQEWSWGSRNGVHCRLQTSLVDQKR